MHALDLQRVRVPDVRQAENVAAGAKQVGDHQAVGLTRMRGRREGDGRMNEKPQGIDVEEQMLRYTGRRHKRSQAKPSQAKMSQDKPNQAKMSQAKPSQAKPSQAKPR